MRIKVLLLRKKVLVRVWLRHCGVQLAICSVGLEAQAVADCFRVDPVAPVAVVAPLVVAVVVAVRGGMHEDVRLRWSDGEMMVCQQSWGPGEELLQEKVTLPLLHNSYILCICNAPHIYFFICNHHYKK